MLIYAHRAMVFSLDPAMMDRTKMVAVSPKAGPQPVPDWVASTETFKIALAAHYVEEVDVPPDQEDKIANLSRRLAPRHVAPIAAETRSLRDYHFNSGLGKVSSQF